MPCGTICIYEECDICCEELKDRFTCPTCKNYWCNDCYLKLPIYNGCKSCPFCRIKYTDEIISFLRSLRKNQSTIFHYWACDRDYKYQDMETDGKVLIICDTIVGITFNNGTKHFGIFKRGFIGGGTSALTRKINKGIAVLNDYNSVNKIYNFDSWKDLMNEGDIAFLI